MINIAISGKANSGKNTLAKMLENNLFPNGVVSTYAFANPIKEMVMKMFTQADKESLYGSSKLRARIIPGTSVTYRQVLCDIGKLGRQYCNDVWVNKFLDHYRSKQFIYQDLYIISDMRFAEEYNALKRLNFVLIRIKRDESSKIDDISETSQDSIPDSAFNYIINNDTDLDDLTNQCIKICSELKGK